MSESSILEHTAWFISSFWWIGAILQTQHRWEPNSWGGRKLIFEKNNHATFTAADITDGE